MRSAGINGTLDGITIGGAKFISNKLLAKEVLPKAETKTLKPNIQLFGEVKEGANVVKNVGEANKICPYELQPTHSLTRSKLKMNELIADIKKNGINEKIKYVEYNGQKYVVDGHHRLLAAKRLGLSEVPVERVKLPYSGYKTVEDLLWFE